MSSVYDFLVKACLCKLKRNQFSPFSVMYNGQEYLIIFKSNYYVLDNDISNFDTSNNRLLVIHANFDSFVQSETDDMNSIYYIQLNNTYPIY